MIDDGRVKQRVVIADNIKDTYYVKIRSDEIFKWLTGWPASLCAETSSQTPMTII